MKISYAITVCNEIEEIKRLIPFLLEHKRDEDEIVVLMDHTKGTQEVWDYLISIESQLGLLNRLPLNKDFAQFKNKLNQICSGTHIFQIDADEIPHENLIAFLPAILEGNPQTQAYWVPRINTVEGITQEHINKWRWQVNEKGWINFPDAQMRIYKNDPNIKWTKPVHEQLVGFEYYASLPFEEGYNLYHPKQIDRQEKQNEFYETI